LSSNELQKTAKSLEQAVLLEITSGKANAIDVMFAFVLLSWHVHRRLDSSLATFSLLLTRLFTNELVAGATCDAMLTMLHAPIRKKHIPRVEAHDSYSCDLCDEFPIRKTRWNCLSCGDFDVCEDCFQRVPFEHPHEKDVFAREEILEESPVFCSCCEEPSLNLVDGLCTVCNSIRFELVGLIKPTTSQICISAMDIAGELFNTLNKLSQTPVISLELIRFLVLSSACCTATNANVLSELKQYVLNVKDLEFQLKAMAIGEMYLPSLFASELHNMLNRVSNGLTLPVLVAAIEFCRQVRVIGTPGDDSLLLNTFKHLWSLSFRKVDLNTKRLLFNLFQHHLGSKEKFQIISKSAHFVGLILELDAKSRLLSQKERACVIDCIKLVNELKASNSSSWAKLKCYWTDFQKKWKTCFLRKRNKSCCRKQARQVWKLSCCLPNPQMPLLECHWIPLWTCPATY
jgi:hypothetical protein